MESVNYWIVPDTARESDAGSVTMLILRIEQWAGVNDITQRTRRRSVCEARQVAAYLLRRNTDYSLRSIGEILNIDHASVSHSVKVVDALLTHDKSFRQQWGVFIEGFK